MTQSGQHIAALPLFPLGTVLFPGGLLPLQIFEVRYLDMIGKAIKAGTPFGVVALTQGHEVRQRQQHQPGDAKPSGDGFANEAFHAVGTLATIAQHAAPQPGLLVVQCLGAQRFHIERQEQLKHGLWIADVRLLAADQAVPVPHELRAAVDALKAFIQQLVAQGVSPDTMPLAAPYALNDCAWVANRWAELLPIDVQIKQRLMALDSPLVRLELVHDLLEKAGLLA
ncbi:MAG: LON peptidase substrate-binding domain-containing protein [Rhodoferax sp.]|nr:LON peptidase substrate-binding domain-containing protein [Rhodoferax sp.]